MLPLCLVLASAASAVPLLQAHFALHPETGNVVVVPATTSSHVLRTRPAARHLSAPLVQKRQHHARPLDSEGTVGNKVVDASPSVQPLPPTAFARFGDVDPSSTPVPTKLPALSFSEQLASHLPPEAGRFFPLLVAGVTFACVILLFVVIVLLLKVRARRRASSASLEGADSNAFDISLPPTSSRGRNDSFATTTHGRNGSFTTSATGLEREPNKSFRPGLPDLLPAPPPPAPVRAKRSLRSLLRVAVTDAGHRTLVLPRSLLLRSRTSSSQQRLQPEAAQHPPSRWSVVAALRHTVPSSLTVRTSELYGERQDAYTSPPRKKSRRTRQEQPMGWAERRRERTRTRSGDGEGSRASKLQKERPC